MTDLERWGMCISIRRGRSSPSPSPSPCPDTFTSTSTSTSTSTFMSTSTCTGSGSKLTKLIAVLCVIALAVAALSCAQAPDDTHLTIVQKRPDEAKFRSGGVSYFLERRCGTLDCHG